MGDYGTFITFYSYKGGVGRTSALVNSAVLRALAGNRVVVVDFDLEAPGTGPYLRRLAPGYREDGPGILEYFSRAVFGRSVPSIRDSAFNLTRSLSGRNGGELWVVRAGNTKEKAYTSRLQELNWAEVFEKHQGELVLKNFKNQIVEEFGKPDYIFIDSRTGITETGGVCTRYLADIVVVMASLNEQNISGTARIYKSFVGEKKHLLVASNVPVGLPYGENQLFRKRIDVFTRSFGRVPDLLLYHNASLSLQEDLPAILERGTPSNSRLPKLETDPLFQSYRELSRSIERLLPTSFLKSVREAGREIRQLSFVPRRAEESGAIRTLQAQYSDRMLAHQVLDLYSLAKMCTDNVDSPKAWDRKKFVRVLKAAEATSNRDLEAAAEDTRNLFSRAISFYVEKHPMTSSLEFFTRRSVLGHLVERQISLKKYYWPIRYLRKSYEHLAKDDYLSRAVNLFNRAHCLRSIGQQPQSRALLGRFVIYFEKLEEARVSGVSRANHYFCAGIANSLLGNKKKANSMLTIALKVLDSLDEQERVFSPVDYKYLPVSEIRTQVMTYLSLTGKNQGNAQSRR